MRTAQAFGTQKTLGNLYDRFIGKAHTEDMKAAVWQGGCLGAFWFVMYAAYALGALFSIFVRCVASTKVILAFNFGTTLINRGEGMFEYLYVIICYE